MPPGDIPAGLADLQIFTGELGLASRNIEFNSLAARYGITLAGNNLYGGAAAGYTTNVVGIGYESSTDKLTATPGSGKSDGLILSELTPLDTAGQYLLAGDKGLTNSLVEVDLPGGISDRWNQI